MSKGKALTYEERQYIESSLKEGKEIIEIAYKLKKSITTIYRDRKRFYWRNELNIWTRVFSRTRTANIYAKQVKMWKKNNVKIIHRRNKIR